MRYSIVIGISIITLFACSPNKKIIVYHVPKKIESIINDFTQQIPKKEKIIVLWHCNYSKYPSDTITLIILNKEKNSHIGKIKSNRYINAKYKNKFIPIIFIHDIYFDDKDRGVKLGDKDNFPYNTAPISFRTIDGLIIKYSGWRDDVNVYHNSHGILLIGNSIYICK